MSEKKARIAVLTYPMLFQTHGGLKMKVETTVQALNHTYGMSRNASLAGLRDSTIP
jgi:hypothetical protein